jgi:hypothetical protein
MPVEQRCGVLLRPLRVLHCPGNVGGNPGQLAHFERKVGLASEAITLRREKFNFQIDEILQQPGDSLIDIELRRWKLLHRAVRDFDVIHFNFGETILLPELYPDISGAFRRSPLRGVWHLYARAIRMMDLPILKAFGKRIAVTYQGDDARQGDYSREHFPINIADHVDVNYYAPGADAWKRKSIAKMARYADLIYALNPDLLHVLPARARFLPYAQSEFGAPVGAGRNDVPVLMHAPTHRGAKGSVYVMDAVQRLQREGLRFEFVLIENMPHDEAMRRYRDADLVIDQLLAGWYGGLAVEVMAMGKPVVCYVREEDLKYIPAGMQADLPLINATPSNIYDVLKQTLGQGRENLEAVGRRSRLFVERWHNQHEIAQRLAHDYRTVVSPHG